MTGQQKGKLPKGFDSIFRELNRFFKPACPTDKLAADIQNKNMEWIKSLTGLCLITYYEAAVAEFTEQLKSGDLTDSNFKEAQHLATTWARKNFKNKLNETTLIEFRKICIGARLTQHDLCAQSSSGNRRASNSISKLPVPERSPAKPVEIAPKRATTTVPTATTSPGSHSPMQTRRILFEPWKSEKGKKMDFAYTFGPYSIH